MPTFCREYPDYKRTPHRHDFSLLPPAKTMLDCLDEAGLDTIGVGKSTIFLQEKAYRKPHPSFNNTDGMIQTLKAQQDDFHGLCFVNLVDFDMVYGHRNDVKG